MENNDETVLISKKEYKQLKYDSTVLSALIGAGVNNWEGYDGIMKALEEYNEEDDKR
jgi:hypothetical protein